MKIETEERIIKETNIFSADAPRTQSGQKLLAIRGKILADGMRLLESEEVNKEVGARRGEHQNHVYDTDLH